LLPGAKEARLRLIERPWCGVFAAPISAAVPAYAGDQIRQGAGNRSDADGTLAEPSVDLAELLVSRLAPAPSYRAKSRNPALGHVSAERIIELYGNGGLAAMGSELDRLRKAGAL
jgi:hypothetical protein